MKKYAIILLSLILFCGCSEEDNTTSQFTYSIHEDELFRSHLEAENFMYLLKQKSISPNSNTLLTFFKEYSTDYESFEIGDLMITDEFDENNFLQIDENTNSQYISLLDFGETKEISLGDATSSIYSPEDINLVIEGIDFQSLGVSKNEDLELSWTTDNNNPNSEMGLTIMRARKLTTIGFTIEGFPLEIPDNGSYTIPKDVFQKFLGEERIFIQLVRKNEDKVGNTAFKFVNSNTFIGIIKDQD